MSDGRVDPTLPLSALLSTWLWGLIRRTPSTEQIGDLLLDRRWWARLGLQPEQGGSPARLAEVLDGLSAEEWNEMMLEDFFLARRAGLLTDDGLYGKRCAALDLNKYRDGGGDRIMDEDRSPAAGAGGRRGGVGDGKRGLEPGGQAQPARHSR